MGDRSWDEFEIIRRFFSRMGSPFAEEIQTGIGDDAAVVKRGKDAWTLVTHDMMVEDVHYRASWMSPFNLARKLSKVNISDIAAMAGTPEYALLSIALPDTLPAGWLEDFSEGLQMTFLEYGVSLIGGDTSRSPGPVMVAITLMGSCGPWGPLLRHAPNAHETLYVSGTLGDAALGLAILNHDPLAAAHSDEEDVAYLTRRHLDPTPRLELGQMLAAKGLATALIDISDGLIGDLEHLLEGVTLGAEITYDAIPRSPAFTRLAPRFHPTPEALILSGGEDYELLFTSPHAPSELKKRAPLVAERVTAIGKITETGEITVVKDGKPIRMESGGFRHQFHQKGTS